MPQIIMTLGHCVALNECEVVSPHNMPSVNISYSILYLKKSKAKRIY